MQNRMKEKRLARLVRHRRVRAKVFGTASRPRLAVFRSANHIFAQLIDDVSGHTICAASDLKGKFKLGTKKSEKAASVGEAIAKAAAERGIKKVVFDRGGFAYHGRVKALADAARKAGLEF
jgi:large subunit ribosomal protein L18